jgi:hypothetical protein
MQACSYNGCRDRSVAYSADAVIDVPCMRDCMQARSAHSLSFPALLARLHHQYVTTLITKATLEPVHMFTDSSRTILTIYIDVRLKCKVRKHGVL